MNRLQPNFYIVFPTVTGPFSPILINLEFHQRLMNNASFVKILEEERGEFPSDDEKEKYFKLQHRLRNARPRKSKAKSFLEAFEGGLPYLHRISKIVDQSFIPLRHKYQNEVFLPTERFFWKYPVVNLGSSRHVMLKDLHVKGSGRNPLSVRMDYHHTWGGNYLFQSMKGYFTSHLLRGAIPQGILETCMVSVHNEDVQVQPVKNSAKSLQFRELQAIRVAQVTTEFDPSFRPTQQEVLKATLKNCGVKSSHELLEKNLFSYASMFLFGIQHLSVTRENVTIEGKLIDYEDVDIVKTQDSHRVKVFIKFPKPRNFDISKLTSIFDKVLNSSLKRAGLFSSSIHYYSFAAELNNLGLMHLDPTLKMSVTQVKQKFKNMLNRVASELFTKDQRWLRFVNELLAHTSARSPDMLHDTSGSNAYAFVKKYQDYISDQILTSGKDFIMANLTFTFPSQMHLRHELLSSFNTKRYGVSVESLVDVCMKQFLLLALWGWPTLTESLDFTSERHSEISQRSLLFPYSYHAGKIRLNQVGKALFLRNLGSACQLPKGSFKLDLVHCFNGSAQLLTIKEFRKLKGPSIVYAVTLKLENDRNYVLNLKPQLLSN